MEKLKYCFKVLGLLFVIAFSYQCGKSIPVEEMGNAKYLVSKAESVKADKHAPTKYETAKAALFQAHDLVSQGDMEKAKEKAIEAGKLAQEAFDLSLPKLAQDTREDAESKIREADEFLASEFAEEEFQNSNDFLAEGNAYAEEKEYEDAIRSYEEAASSAGKARDIAEAQVEMIKSSALEIEDRIKQSEQYGSNEKFPDELARAKKLLADAQKKLGDSNFKEARTILVEADEISMKLLNDSIKTWAENLYKEAEEYVKSVNDRFEKIKDQIKNNKKLSAEFQKEEKKQILESTQTSMDAANESLVSAKTALEDATYQNSKDHSEEANRLAKIVQDQFPQFSVLFKESSVRLVDSSREDEQGEGQGEVNLELGEGWKQYVVQYRPARRDCLWRISGYNDIYGNPRMWPRIYKANKSKIKNPDLIYPGQRFDIPPKRGNTNKKQKVDVLPDKVEENDKLGIKAEDNGNSEGNLLNVE